jgi:hypothetical protein
MDLPLELPMTHLPHTEGICESCNRRTRVRAVRLKDGVRHVCERCHPPEPTTTED